MDAQQQDNQGALALLWQWLETTSELGLTDVPLGVARAYENTANFLRQVVPGGMVTTP